MNECCNCGISIEERDTYYIEGDAYCEDCYYNTEYSVCDSCGEAFYNINTHWDDNTERCYCDDCYSRLEENTNSILINSYHSSRDNYKKLKCLYLEEEIEGKEEDDLTYYGIELEVERTLNSDISNNDMAKIIMEISKHYGVELSYEEDSSLCRGFEIITPKMTKGFIKSTKGMWYEILEALRNHNFRSHNGGDCGLHIHFSKVAFGQGEEYINNLNKLALFSETYKKELIAFSRRKSFGYCQWASEGRLGDGSKISDSLLIKSSEYCRKSIERNKGSHSTAINLHKDDEPTIEFRFFRGTLIFETFMSALELTMSIVEMLPKLDTKKISFNKIVKNKENEYCQNYCKVNGIFNSNALKDETKKIKEIITNNFKETEFEREKIDNNFEKNFKKVKGLVVKLAKEITEETTIEELNPIIEGINIVKTIVSRTNYELENVDRNNIESIMNDLTLANNYLSKEYINRIQIPTKTDILKNRIGNELCYISNNAQEKLKELKEIKDKIEVETTTIKNEFKKKEVEL